MLELCDRKGVKWRYHEALKLTIALKQFSHFVLFGCVWQILDKQNVMVPLTLSSWCAFKNIDIDDTLVFQPLLGLINNDGLAFGHFDGHTASFGVLVEEFSLGLVELLGHGCGHCILVHEQVVPVGLIVEIGAQNLFFFLLVICGRSFRVSWVRGFGLMVCLVWLLVFVVLMLICGLVVVDGLFWGGRLFLSWFDMQLASLEVRLV